jgi:hypothetical protein
MSAADVLHGVHGPLLRLNFGFGHEIWEVESLDGNWVCDRQRRALANGRLVLHEGSADGAVRFLREHGIDPPFAAVKW